MSDLTDKITELKAKYPKLQKGVNDDVIDLDLVEYEKTIAAWAEEELKPKTPSFLDSINEAPTL
jgi:hypothetical protein